MADVGFHDVYGLAVGASLGDDEVGKALGGLYELLVHGLQHVQIAVDDHLRGASALHGVAQDVADKSHVGISVHIDLQVHKVAQVLAVQCHDTLNDDDFAGFHVHGLGQTVGGDVVVGGLFYGLALAQVVQLAAKQVPVECIGVVIVDEPALFHGQMRVVVVVRILRNHRHILALECLHYLSDHGGLSASRATCYSYNIHCRECIWLCFTQRS